ncbi:CapA family protein [Halorubrum lipolyticum]|uniref:Poly-gamma-glutamate synthesis protein (Capsule biosynthesis protein) n=1 Tax=Halorubrum lipolyticum DSM 21995 TaxID=1227482 RepID=M0NZV9_9EURY|nr:CapA family protein [Halorubrum lipolyticum]EMA63083.1 poly-gamma-glutamate synthesis protein (capsule biosynthesis protein) [Halorubrum lipolyticum DSM 21995]
MRTRRTLLASGIAGLAGVAGCAATPPTADGESREAAGDTADASDDSDTADPDATRIGFVGDLMLGRSVNERWADDDPENVWGTTLSRLRDLDGLVGNLECCVSDRGTRWPDKGYYFRSDPAFAVPALEAAGASFVSLANNHVLDYGEPALRDTDAHLTEAGIAHAGSGTDRESALEPALFEAGDLTVAAFGLTDQSREFAAGASTAGTSFATLDPARSATRSLVEAILDRAAARDPDLVVASLHWGPNWETEPRAVHERFGRWLIERGVDVVHGHSAHVLQGVEVYLGRPIIYDAGDFVDDYVSYQDRQGVRNKRSALFELVARDGGLDELVVEPIEIVDEAATLADDEVSEWVRDTLAERSAVFETEIEQSDDQLVFPLGEE